MARQRVTLLLSSQERLYIERVLQLQLRYVQKMIATNRAPLVNERRAAVLNLVLSQMKHEATQGVET